MVELTVDPAWLAQTRSLLGGYHDLLAGPGLERGVIGPREVPRLWSRHLENCAAVADPSLGLLPAGVKVADLGTGAGLPGLVWALVRPDLRVVLVDPLERRTAFLAEVSQELGPIPNVGIVRARAQDIEPLAADVVTSRALAHLTVVVEWSARHVVPGGHLIALKGGKASEELGRARETIVAHGGDNGRVIRIGPVGADGHPLATVVDVRFSGGQRG